MTLLAPLALCALIAIPVIILIHYLRGSRRRIRVPSIELWQGFEPGLTARNRIRRPPLSILLLLQILIAAALGLALSRPGREGDVNRHLGLVIDASASMQATDISPNRFEAARAVAARRIQTLAGTDQVTLIRASDRPRVVFSGLARDAESALKELEPGSGSTAMLDALLVATNDLQRTTDLKPELVLITDGAFEGQSRLPATGIPTEIIPVGSSNANQAIVSLEARAQPSGRSIDVLVVLANYEARPVRVELQLLTDDIPAETRRVDVPAKTEQPATFAVPLQTGRITARLSGRDTLALDNVAETPAPSIRPRSIVLVSSRISAMDRALQAIPGARVTTLNPADYDGRSADLTVFDSVTPKPMPAGPMLLVHPPTDNGIFPISGEIRFAPITIVDATHPLLLGVDLNALRVNRADQVKPPVWAHTVIGTPRGPLVMEGNRGGQPVTVFTFDPIASGLDKSIAFPVLVANAVSSMLATTEGPALYPGQQVTLPVSPDGKPVVVQRPDGQREQLQSALADTRYERTDQVGRYTVRDSSGSRTLRSFSVSLLDGLESNITPITITPPTVSASIEGLSHAIAEWWRWLVAAALVLLTLEWLVFARRG